MRKTRLTSSEIFHIDATIVTIITTHFQQVKHQSHQNSLITLIHGKTNMNHKYSKSSFKTSTIHAWKISSQKD